MSVTETIDDTAKQAAQATPSILDQITDVIWNFISPISKDVLTVLRVPTPIKVTKMIPISSTGNIGTSFNDLSNVIYTAPVSTEAWLHRITITCPENGPGNPIVSPAVMQIMGTTFGEVILQLPEIATTEILVPNQFIEGRLSAPHLDRGESLCVSGNGLPAGAHIRFDLQISLVQGITEFTPKTNSPTNITTGNGTPAAIA